VAPPDSTLATGLTQQFSATGVYSDGSKANISSSVTWTSSVPNVAVISNALGNAGVATAISVGGTTITATLGGITGSTTLTVTGATLVSIAVTPTSQTAAKDTPLQYTATGIYSNKTLQNLTTDVTWSSSNTGVATISNASGSIGVAETVAAGTTAITATLGSLTGSTPLTVTNATLVGITITPANSSIASGSTEQLTATGMYSDNSTQNLTDYATWSSSNSSLAAVSNTVGSQGIATAVSEGTVTIQATFGGITGTTKLSIVAVALQSINITPATASDPAGSNQQFTATGVYNNNSTQNITSTVIWSSSNSAVASISNAFGFEGYASALTPGQTMITATLSGISASVSFTVTNATLVSITITPANPTADQDSTVPFTATGIYSDNTTQDLTAVATWTSSKPAVAAISNAAGTHGEATTLTAGTTAIEAVYQNVQAPPVTLTVTTGKLVSITVTAKPGLSVPKGTPVQFTATGHYSDGTTEVLPNEAWTSSTTAVATISNAPGSNGAAATVGVGMTQITAMDPASGLSSTPVTLTVTAAALTSITVAPINPSTAAPVPSIPLGTTQAFTATGTFTDGTTQNLTTTVTWQSGTLATATISNAAGTQGVATSASIGTTAISAVDPAYPAIASNQVTLTVTAATLVSIAVTPNPTTAINIGQTQQFTATGTYSDGTTANITTTVTWVATPATFVNIGANTGLATGTVLGTTEITASLGSLTSNPVPLTVVEIAYALNFDNPNNNGTDGSITEYQIFPDGQLTLLATFSPTGVKPYDLAIDLTTTDAYVVNFSQSGNGGSINEFTVAPTGVLGANGSLTTNDGPNSIAINPAAAYAYVANEDGGVIDEYSIANGTLNLVTTVPLTSPISVAVNRAGTFAYVAAGTAAGTVSVYPIQNGALAVTPTQTIACGNAPNEIVIDPFDRFAYVVNYTAGTVSQYSIDAANGTLTPIGTGVVAADPAAATSSITLDALGQNAYVTNRNAGTVWQYSINQTTGALTFVSSVTAGTNPSWLAIDASGHYAYVTDRVVGGSTIAEFSITDGTLLPIGTAQSTGTDPVSIFTAP